MRAGRWTMAMVAATIAAACGDGATATGCCDVGAPSLRVINAFTSPVDVLIDGRVAIKNVAAGTVATASPFLGPHLLELRAKVTGATTTQSLDIDFGAVHTIAAVRSATGALASVALDDTNSVVPANATKVRVLHFAPNAGTLQVYRTQPDWLEPIAWQTPFTYQANPTSLSAPFYQSTPGNWVIRVWKAPADASGWTSGGYQITLGMAGGEKRTVVLLDDGNGGVRATIM